MFDSVSSEQIVPSQRTRSDELFERFLETWLEEEPSQTLMDATLSQPSPFVDSAALKPHQLLHRPGFTMNPYEVDPFTQALRVPAIPAHQVYMPVETFTTVSAAGRPTEPARRAGKESNNSTLLRNRKAQARFRDKQKQKERDLQEQVQELQRQLKEAHMEAVCAKRQNEVLSKVLEIRESNIHVLKENARLIEQPAAAPAAAPSSAAQPPEDAPPKATLEECRGIDRVAAAARWRDYVQSMATHLVSVELAAVKEGGGAMARLEAVTLDALNFVQLMSVVNPGVARKMVNTYMDSLEAAETPLPKETLRDGGWRTKLDALMLTEEQIDKIQFLFSRHKETIARLDRELEPHKSDLDALMPIASSDANDKACRFADEGPAMLQHSEVVSFLRRNIQLRHEAWSGLGVAILSKILTPLQCARFCVTSYPMFPICHQVLAFVDPSFYAGESSTASAPSSSS